MENVVFLVLMIACILINGVQNLKADRKKRRLSVKTARLITALALVVDVTTAASIVKVKENGVLPVILTCLLIMLLLLFKLPQINISRRRIPTLAKVCIYVAAICVTISIYQINSETERTIDETIKVFEGHDKYPLRYAGDNSITDKSDWVCESIIKTYVKNEGVVILWLPPARKPSALDLPYNRIDEFNVLYSKLIAEGRVFTESENSVISKSQAATICDLMREYQVWYYVNYSLEVFILFYMIFTCCRMGFMLVVKAKSKYPPKTITKVNKVFKKICWYIPLLIGLYYLCLLAVARESIYLLL